VLKCCNSRPDPNGFMRGKGDGGGTKESAPSGKPDGRLEPYLRLVFILYLFQALRLPLSAISIVDPLFVRN